MCVMYTDIYYTHTYQECDSSPWDDCISLPLFLSIYLPWCVCGFIINDDREMKYGKALSVSKHFSFYVDLIFHMVSVLSVASRNSIQYR